MKQEDLASLTEEQKDFVLEISQNFPQYSNSCLYIIDKSANLVPLELNQPQLYIHKRLEQQLEEFGRVRALVLKGRQQGCSTYIEARYYWKTHWGRGLRAFILSHESEASNNLFRMAKRYHDNCPEIIRPYTKASNIKELAFKQQECSYRVATAGVDAVGRSETIHLFHGSEVAYWPHADEHASGVLQAIPGTDGTESILESTANGMSNLFHSMWVSAEKGESDYIAIFVPWFWSPEYVRPVPDGFILETKAEEEGQLSEAEYAETYELSMEQMAWRRAKIVELGTGGSETFRREYPATSSEAFQSSGVGLLIPPARVIAARKLKSVRATGPRIAGVDPAGDGVKSDRTVIAIRQGRIFLHIEIINGMDLMEITARIVELNVKFRLDKVFVEKDGLGSGLVDRLNELITNIVGVNAGNTGVMKPDRYANKRSECAGEMRDWFDDTPCCIPDDDEVQTDFSAVRRRYNSNSQLALEDKKIIKKDFGISTDIFDAMGLTFAFPVTNYDHSTHEHEFLTPNLQDQREKKYRPGRSGKKRR